MPAMRSQKGSSASSIPCPRVGNGTTGDFYKVFTIEEESILDKSLLHLKKSEQFGTGAALMMRTPAGKKAIA
jgi:hypothetical protein